MRRLFAMLVWLALLPHVVATPAGITPPAASQPAAQAITFPVEEIAIADLEAAYLSGRTTARAVTQAQLDRIEAYDKRAPPINALITVNPHALEEADRLDTLLKASGKPVGPLHGIRPRPMPRSKFRRADA